MSETFDLNDLVASSQVTNERPRYKLRTAADALAPQPPIEWVVAGLFSAGSVSLVVGEGGSKKTWLCLDMAVGVALGEYWLGRETMAGPVLIIDEESGNRRLSDRLGKVLRGHQAGGETPLYYVSLAQFDFSQSEDIQELESLINETGARLVVIDAMADIMPGRDENAVKDMQPVFLGLRHVAEATQAALVMIHHSNKGGDYRGSTAIKGAVDLMVMVSSEQESPNINLKSIKVRDTEPFNLAAVAYFGDDTFNLATSTSSGSSEKKLGKAQEFVIRYLASLPDRASATIAEIQSKADSVSPESARTAVYNLAGLTPKLVRRFDDGSATGGRGNQASYGLTEEGQEYAKRAL